MMGRVLFLDDQEEILELLKRMLKDEAFQSFFAQTPDQAFEILRENEIDVVVSDMIMPHMNGMEFLDIVKREYPKVVRIILSGYSQVATILEAINSGQVYRFLTKPWKIDDKAREIIHDSISYSRMLKDRDDENSIRLKYKNFIYILEEIANEYVLVNNGKRVMEMNAEGIEINYDDCDTGLLLEKGFKMYEVDEEKQLFIR